jgi:hypothetical protein
MKQVTLSIPDKKYSFFIELVNSLGFVKKIDGETSQAREEILDGVREAVQEMNLIKQGKLKARDAREIIHEL